jgi:uncharacterized protein (DUF2267 family)
MTMTGLDVFDTTIQQSNRWLKAMMSEMVTEDRHAAYVALKATLQALRDRVGPENAVHFGAQLPILMRGVLFENWHIAGTPTSERTAEEFVARVERYLPPNTGIDAQYAAHAGLAAVADMVDEGEVRKLMRILPHSMAELFPQYLR